MTPKRAPASAKKRRPHRKSRAVPIHVKLGQQPTIPQPNDTFRVCPLGLQFYSPKKVADFQMMDFRMQMAQGNGRSREVTCAGVVVHCQKEKATSLYRVWVKFLDPAKGKCARLESAAKHADTICPHCENF